MDEGQEQARLEAEAWNAFEAALSRVPRERMDDPGVLDVPWTIKEMLHHVTGWLRECTQHLEARAAGTFIQPDESDDATDLRNAAFAEEARGMDTERVRQELDAAREELLRRWNGLRQIDEDSLDEFASETYEHYEEHLPDLRRAAGA